MSDLMARVAYARSQFDGLRTFDDVQRWDRTASSLVGELERATEEIRARTDTLNAEVQQAVRTRAALSFFTRIFAGRGNERELQREMSRLAEERSQFAASANELLEFIDYSPNNEKERKAVLKELRAEKKELQLAKRQVAAKKRDINREAREASADAGRILFLIYDRKLAASERRQIRRQKSAALGPYEDMASSIDRQLRDLERRIMWVQRFGDDD